MKINLTSYRLFQNNVFVFGVWYVHPSISFATYSLWGGGEAAGTFFCLYVFKLPILISIHGRQTMFSLEKLTTLSKVKSSAARVTVLLAQCFQLLSNMVNVIIIEMIIYFKF